MKKKIISLLLCGVLIFSSGCAIKKTEENTGKLKIVTTLFPQYDFTREIVKDKCDVVLLMPPGAESHTFEPSVHDTLNVENADIFIYTGDDMEPWAHRFVEASDNKDMLVIDVSKNVEKIAGHHHHHHEDKEEHDDHEECDLKHPEECKSKGHHHDFDPHIWTSPKNAMVMVDTILEGIIEKDKDNEEFYRSNSNIYKEKLSELDNLFKDVVKNSKSKEMIFAGKFALKYFVKDYGLSYFAAYDSCMAESEPSIKILANIINEIKENNASAIFYEELTDPKAARIVAEETGVSMYLFHSCHNLTKDELERGENYISLMEKNAENLRKGLN